MSRETVSVLCSMKHFICIYLSAWIFKFRLSFFFFFSMFELTKFGTSFNWVIIKWNAITQCWHIKKKKVINNSSNSNYWQYTVLVGEKIVVVFFTKLQENCSLGLDGRWKTEPRLSDCGRQWRFRFSVGFFACVQDFEMNGELKLSVICLLEEVLRDPDLLPQERKATANILRCPTCGKRSAHEWSSRMSHLKVNLLNCFTFLNSVYPPPAFTFSLFIVISCFFTTVPAF